MNIPKHSAVKKSVTFVLSAFFITGLLTYAYNVSLSPSRARYDPNSALKTTSYVIYKNSATVVAMSSTTGGIDYSGTNAVTVIQNAMDALTSGGEILVKAGTYAISASIIIRNSVTLVLEQGAILQASGISNVGFGKPMIAIRKDGDVENVEICGGIFDCNGNAEYGISCGYTVARTFKNIYIHDLEIKNTNTNDGIYFAGGTFKNIVIDRCRFSNIARRDITFTYFKGENVIAKNNFLHRGITFEAPSNPTYSPLDNLIIEGNQYRQQIADNIVINVIGRNYTYGFVRISDNQLYSLNYPTTKGDRAINVYGLRNAIIEGNQILGFGSITWNTGAINLDGTDGCQGVAVVNNNIRDCTIGIKEWAPSNYNTIKHNDVSLNVATPIVKSGTNTEVRFNIGFVTENSGIVTAKANGGTIAHGLAGTPTIVQLTSLNATYDGVGVIVAWDRANSDSKNISLDIYWSNGTAITNPVIDISWYAEYKP